MSIPLAFIAIVIIGVLLYGIIRSRLLQSKLLDAAAQREKHTPKAAEVPKHFTSAGSRIQEFEVTQPKKHVQQNQSVESRETYESRENLESRETHESRESHESRRNHESRVHESASRQIDELSMEEREKYDARDQARDENIVALRLLVEDLFEVDRSGNGEGATDLKQEQSSVELRNSWIQHYEAPLNEHAAFIEQEEIGSGIRMMETAEIENNDIQDRIEREGGKTGEVQISLAWDDFNDLDLHLFCPSGERIYFNNRKSACGGELDVDMNVRPTSEKAVENIVWPEKAPLGKYKVGVHFYKHHSKEDTTTVCTFRARIRTHGKTRDYSGSITHGQAMQMVTSFTLNR